MNKRGRIISKPLFPVIAAASTTGGSASTFSPATAAAANKTSAFATSIKLNGNMTPTTLRERGMESYSGMYPKISSTDKYSVTLANLITNSSSTATATGVSKSE